MRPQVSGILIIAVPGELLLERFAPRERPKSSAWLVGSPTVSVPRENGGSLYYSIRISLSLDSDGHENCQCVVLTEVQNCRFRVLQYCAL